VEVQKNSVKKDTRGWPGTDTAMRLAFYNCKLIVQDNPVGLLVAHILNVPIKKMHIETTWLVLRGLKNKWIKLMELQPDEALKTPVVRKQVSAIETTPPTRENIANETEDEEEEEEEEEDEEETDDEEDDEVDEDELIDDPAKFFDGDDDDEEDDDYEIQ
jgi:hypothetical protein